jgi:hypothetical protein
MNAAYFRQLNKFATNTEISRDEMIQMTLDYYEPFKIYSFKLDGTRIVREMFSVVGPSGNVKYDYAAKGYMIFQDDTAGGWRTIVYKNVYKIEMGGKTYLIK